jgi:hypothetical protein
MKINSFNKFVEESLNETATVDEAQTTKTTATGNAPIAKFPKGCTITNIRPGKGDASRFVVAELRGPDGSLLISASIGTIAQRLLEGGVEK